MKDQRAEKIQKHYDIYFNTQKFKVLSCQMDEDTHKLFIKTKIKGQPFPKNRQFVIKIPSENISREVRLSFQSMTCNAALEHWEYEIL
jgi:hypothetical protein